MGLVQFRGIRGIRRRVVAGVATVGAVVLAGSPAALQTGAARATTQPDVTLSQVSKDLGVDAGEGWVVTDPHNPQAVMVDWLYTSDVTQQNGGDANASPANLTRGYCGFGLSTDGGRTWPVTKQLPFAMAANTVGDPVAVGPIPGPHTGNRNVPVCGDPVLGIAPDGTVVAAAAIIASPQLEQAITSTTQGSTWSDPAEVFGVDQTVAGARGNASTTKTVPIGPGRAWMAVDPITGDVSINSQEDGGVEGRYLVVSHDKSKTWGTPRPIDPDVQGKSAGMQSAAFGTIAVAYVVDQTSPTYLAANPPAISCTPPATSCAVFETTTDDGVTWNRHLLPTLSLGTPSTKIVAADPTTPRHFAVLVNNGRDFEVWSTTDSGTTWSRNTVIAAPGNASLIKPAISFSPTGAIGVVWRAVYADTSYDVFAEVSRDGGSTWSSPVTLTVDGPAPPWNQMSDDCACNISMTASSLAAIWGDGRSGSRQLWFARFDYSTL